ncbi:MAG: VanZ family protein [Polaromonas sp.]
MKKYSPDRSNDGPLAARPSAGWISSRWARGLLALLVLSLLVGTQMPGVWRNGIEHGMHAPMAFSSWAHFVLFIGLTLVMAMRPLAWPVARVLLATLALALLTEGLQFFAIDRHPRLSDVGIDMAGTLLALAFLKWKNSARFVRL